MTGFEFLEQYAKTLDETVKQGEYKPVEIDDNLPQLSNLKNHLKVVGAKVTDYQVTGSEKGNYCARPCISLNDGELVLFFSPTASYKIPNTAVLLNNNELTLANGKNFEDIIVRKVEGVSKMANYDALLDYFKSKLIVKMDEFFSTYDDSLPITLLKVESLTSKKGNRYQLLEVGYKDETVKLFASQKVANQAEYLLATGNETCKIVAHDYIGKDDKPRVEYRLVYMR